MESKIETKDAATKTRNKKRRPLPPRKSDGQLIAEEAEYEIKKFVQEGVDAGSRFLIFSIMLPDAPQEAPTFPCHCTAYAPRPACYAVVECNAMFSCERGRAETWEATCALLDSLRGTQQRGWHLQINGLNKAGYVVAWDMLKYGLRRDTDR